ncbi:MAG: peptide deformylase [Candidatus Margulisbacteria bacterium GWF2_35_9]|nr:MAG: peptide deformylase [Candidatus Margulisbacteria bacterium GWF2_35_9]
MFRKIILNSNPILRKKCKAVNKIDPEIRKLIADMEDTMYENNGAGLAAIQVGVLKRVIVVDTSIDKNELLILINPKIIEKKGQIIWQEACLSVPGFEGTVKRYDYIKVKAKDKQFKDIIVEGEGYLAVALQHEIDHLDGILYIDRVEDDTLKSVNAEDEHAI